MTIAEQRILDLSAKVIALQNTDEFQDAVAELRACLHEYLENTRSRVVELAVIIRNESQSKAA